MSISKEKYSELLSDRGNFCLVPNELFCREDIDPIAKVIWCYLVSMPEAWSSSRNNIARNLGIHHSTVSDRIKLLVDRGMLKLSVDADSWSFEILPTSNWMSTELPDIPVSKSNRATACTGTELPDISVPSYGIAHIKDYKTQDYISLTDSKNISTKSKRQAFDLEAIYKKYPRKQGKARGMKKLTSIIKSQKAYDEMMTAVENYALTVRDCKPEFIKQFSTFVNGDWQDYVPESGVDIKPKITGHVERNPEKSAFERLLEASQKTGEDK